MTEETSRPGWASLRQYTKARIAIGRTGTAIPTAELLRFQLAHAQARDAVYSTLDAVSLQAELGAVGREAIVVQSAAGDRRTYLVRPDLGRQLSAVFHAALAERASVYDVAFVVVDGLSATATNRHAVPLLKEIMPLLEQQSWRIAPLVLVTQGRVAIGDEVANRLGATLTVVLIGERPGLSSPDSLGIYLTYGPKAGETTDAERNCLSNIRPEGLSYGVAAAKLFYLMTEAHRRRLTGVDLKDEALDTYLGE